jgi:transposase-like protein
MGYTRKLSKEEAEKAAKESFSIAEFCRNVGWKAVGGHYKQVHHYITLYNLDVSHFTGCRTNLGNRLNKGKETKMKDYENVERLVRGPVLLKKLLNEGIKERKCECCGGTEWLGKPIPLEVHHINGNFLNNNVENLQLLCPNCHTFTDNFTGKKNRKEPKKYFCKECGKEITIYSKSGLCVACSNKKNAKTEISSKEEFIKTFLEYRTFSGVARKYGCSGNNIVKRARRFGLPTKINEMKEYLRQIEENENTTKTY